MLGWLVGYLKARTGAHEVIVTIMLNYVMYNLLSYLLGTPSALQPPQPVQPDQPDHRAADAQLPHVGGPPPQVGVGFLVAAGRRGRRCGGCSPAAPSGFQFRTVGANPNAARTAGMSVDRTWVAGHAAGRRPGRASAAR